MIRGKPGFRVAVYVNRPRTAVRQRRQTPIADGIVEKVNALDGSGMGCHFDGRIRGVNASAIK